MYKKYLDEAKKIYYGFNHGDTEDWLSKNGMTELQKMLLDDIKYAKNDTEFERAKFQYKRRILDPYYKENIAQQDQSVIDKFYEYNPLMGMDEPKGLGSYDELKKNPKLTQSKYARRNVDKDGKESVDVPLLRLVNDEKELASAASFLHVSPEELRDHVLNEWDKKKKREWVEEEKAMRKAIVDGGEINGVKFQGRKGVLKEFDKNPWGTVLKEVSPDIYAAMRRDIANGTGESGDPTKWQNTHMREQLNDMIRSVGLAASATVVPWMVPAKYAMAAPVFTGLGVGATEYGAMANSNYYPLNDENKEKIKSSAYAAATIPGGVNAVLGLGRKFGGPVISRAFSKARRFIHGEEVPSLVEKNALYNEVDKASEKVLSELKKEYRFSTDDVGGAIGQLTDKLNKTPKSYLDGRKFTDDEVREMLKSNSGIDEIKSFFNAPSLKTFSKWNKRAQDEDEAAIVRNIYRKAVDAVGETFPMAKTEIQEFGSSVGKTQRLADYGAIGLTKLANSYYGIKEPVEQRKYYKEGLEPYESANPEQVEAWKRYGIPSWDPLAEEFNEKYGEGK